MAPSSLLARRQSMGLQLPALECNKSKDESGPASPASTAASSVERRSCSSGDQPSSPATPQQDLSGFAQASRRFSRPSINISLVRRDSLSSDPFKASECQKLSERFEGLMKLGEGSCAVVYRAVALSDKREVALKVLRIDDEERLEIARREYSLLQQLNHPNIVEAFDFFTYTCGAVLVEEFFNGKSLDKIINNSKDGHMTEMVARPLFIRLLDAIAYLHKHGVIHRDVKAQNVLISQDMTDLRLIDFNASKRLADGGDLLTMTGTREYMPPEVLKGNSPSDASDVWASGLCFYYMLTGDLPSRRSAASVQLKGAKWELLSKSCKDIVRKCLEPRRDLRPPAQDILDFTRAV